MPMSDEYLELNEVARNLCMTAEEVLQMVERAELPYPRLRGNKKVWSLKAVNSAMDAGGCEQWFVYFVEASGLIKIGTTTNVTRRMFDISSMVPGGQTKLLHYVKGGYAIEGEYHRKFARLRVNGEWFRSDPPLLEFIEGLKARTENEQEGQKSEK